MKATKYLIAILFYPLLSNNLIAKEVQLERVKCTNEHQIIDLTESKSGRIITPDGQGSKYFFKVPPEAKNIVLKEEPRKSRISEDLVTLSNLTRSMLPIAKTKEKAKKECLFYQQSHKRATIELAITDDLNNTINYNFTTGKKEHYFLSADMIVTGINELYYDTKTNSIIEKEQPASFYVAFNYKLGDVFTNYPINEFYNNISIKALAKVSEKPSESMGIGLGYTVFDGIEIFIAQVWTQDNKNVKRSNLGHTPTITYGVSFNLNRGLEWIQNSLQQ